MAILSRLKLIVFGLALSVPALADISSNATNPMPAIRADQWNDAAVIAAGLPDPVALKLVTYFRLLSSGGARLAELAAFIAVNPDWPAQAQLERRRQEALVAEPDAALVLTECDRGPITLPATLARCADAWRAAGRDATATMPPSRGGDGWNQRQRQARQMLHDGDAQGAYDLVVAHEPGGTEAETDAEFLAGFIALRKLNKPDLAARHFAKLAAMSHAVITQGRANYWLGRAQAAAAQDPKHAYEAAAAYPTSFYGQLAAVALGDTPTMLARRIGALRDPGWNELQVRETGARELVRAAVLLSSWDDPRRANIFVLRLDELAPDASGRSLNARFATALGLPQAAVFIARRMGRDGIPLPEAGWPKPVDPPRGPIDPAVTLGLIRQESSFETAVVSPAGARGLMQLMPGTAALVGKQLGQPVAVSLLTVDPELNMQLGTAYLQTMLDRFGGSLPLAFAAYNAGPNRVDTWLTDNGDPRHPPDDNPRSSGAVNMLDWIELISFAETRNYVQRVLENVVIYRARLGDSTPTLDPRWNR